MKELYEEYVKYISSRLKAGSVRSASDVLRLFVLPDFGDKEIDKEYFRNEEKFDWRTRNKEMSMERLQKEFGMDMPDDAPAVDEQVINEDFIKRFISVLTEPQKEIFKKAYIENKSLRLISRETNTCLSTVQKHILLIQKKFIKNFLQKGGQK